MEPQVAARTETQLICLCQGDVAPHRKLYYL